MFETLIDNEVLRLRVQYLAGVPYVHCDVYQWNKTLYKAFKQVWKRFLHKMDGVGHPCVFSLVPEADVKALKFNKMFGFKEVETTQGVILLMCDTEAVWALIR